jgi:hypothetical protein
MKKIFSLCCFFSLLVPAVGVQAQTAVDGNFRSKTNLVLKVPEGLSVIGVYEGRCPCKDIARQMKISVSDDCIKLKWRLTLFQVQATGSAHSFRLEGTPFRDAPKEGKLSLTSGPPAYPDAIVYRLDLGKPLGSLTLMKADDNLLFFIDEEKKFYVGNENFSYTLNRVAY